MPGNLLSPLTFLCWPRSHEAMTPNGDQRYGRPSGRLYFMRKGDFDGYHPGVARNREGEEDHSRRDSEGHAEQSH